MQRVRGILIVVLVASTFASIAPPLAGQPRGDKPGGILDRPPMDPQKIERDIAESWRRHLQDQWHEFRPLTSKTLRQAIEDFRAGTVDARKDLAVFAESFVTADGKPFVALQLSRPADGALAARETATVFGEILGDGGGPLLGFEADLRPVASGDRVLVTLPLRLPAGEHPAVFGVAVGGRARFMGAGTLRVRAIDPEAFDVAGPLLADDVHVMSAAQRPDEPFAFGGIAVVPRGDLRFAARAEPWLFVAVRHPALDAAGRPKIGVRLEIEGPAGGAAARRALPVAEPEPLALGGFSGEWGVGVPLSFAGWVPGAYQMMVEVSDGDPRHAWKGGVAFRIAAPGAAAAP